MFGAVECDGVQLLHVKNPWIVKEGTIEWTGDWCDTSAKWSEYPSVAAACGFTVTWGLVSLVALCSYKRTGERGGYRTARIVGVVVVQVEPGAFPQ